MENMTLKELRQALEVLFTGYRTMKEKLRRQLKKLGIQVVEGNKIKLLFEYTGKKCLVCIAKTASDQNCGRYIAREIIHQIQFA